MRQLGDLTRTTPYHALHQKVQDTTWRNEIMEAESRTLSLQIQLKEDKIRKLVEKKPALQRTTLTSPESNQTIQLKKRKRNQSCSSRDL